MTDRDAITRAAEFIHGNYCAHVEGHDVDKDWTECSEEDYCVPLKRIVDTPREESKVVGWECETCQWILPLNPDTDHGWPENEMGDAECPGVEFMDHPKLKKRPLVPEAALVESQQKVEQARAEGRAEERDKTINEYEVKYIEALADVAIKAQARLIGKIREYERGWRIDLSQLIVELERT